MIFKPYTYQNTAMDWIFRHKRCCLFLDMGLGKTVSTLTAVQDLMDLAEVRKTLVVAPKKVAETVWSKECEKWDHLFLRVSKVLGSSVQREKALSEDADVYVIGRDNFVWLVDFYKAKLPFDCLVIDELTSFKSNRSQRFKAMKGVSTTFDRVIGLTGTPAPNGLIDLWAPMYIMDQGARLGKSLTAYRDTYFNLRKWNNIIVKCTVKKGMDRVIRDRISDICLSMQAKDYLELPDMIVHDVMVDLGESKPKYDQFEKEQVLTFLEENSESNVIANSAAGLMNKLQQFAGGAVYDDDGNAHEIHTAKLDCLREIVESAMASECHVLVFYQFVSEIPRIASALKGWKVRKYDSGRDLDDWNEGKIEVLLAHPASTAYGLNMQQGGHIIVWYGLTWNLELYQQANARLHRQGQEAPVQVFRLLASETVDESVRRALSGKDGVQDALLHALSEMASKHGASYDNDKEGKR